MNKRPNLSIELDSVIFRNFYYLKEELVDFCRDNGLQKTGGKIELTERIAIFLDTGKKQISVKKGESNKLLEITIDSIRKFIFV